MENFYDTTEKSDEGVKVKYGLVVTLQDKFKEKIDWISSNYEKEVNGFITGTIEKDSIILEDLLIPYQEADSASCEVTGENIVKLRKEYKDKCKKIIGEWHSHHSMSAFWSGDDERVINDFAEPRETSIFIVSAKGNHLVRVELRKPFKISLDCLPYEVEATESKVGKEMTKEIEKKVTVPERIPNVYDWKDNKKNKYPMYQQTKEEREIRKEVNVKVRFFNKKNMIEISDLTYYQKAGLENDFSDLNPTCFAETGGNYRLEYHFNNKTESLGIMKEIKENLIIIMKEENDVNSASEEYTDPSLTGTYDSYDPYNQNRSYL